MDDTTLIIECVNGNVKAQRFLFDKFAPKMLAVCMRYTKNKSDAEDVLQDAFIKVFKNIGAFKNEGSLEGWIRRIMVNTSLDQIRKNNKFLKDTELDAVSYKLEKTDFSFDNLETEDLLKMINNMPNGYKIVFNMFAIEGYSHQEIASTLGVSENTSKSQYLRARSYLKNELEKINFER
ncbi:MAG: RNA polymerase sigma factor [Crocinitomicaceae bacterium]|nr:RNA polymerase sigma factor [Crocinitomicaceae bacterium]